MKFRFKPILVGMVVLSCAGISLAADVTTSTLLDEMISFDRLTKMPQPFYHTYQVSSYDRRANTPGGPGWFENSDGFGNEPIPAVLKVLRKADKSGVGTYLLAEQNGPGAIVRCWTAARHRTWYGCNGTIRMYLDGAEKPVFDGSARDFLIDLYSGIAKQHGINPKGLSKGYTQRDSCYCPIGFAKSCRIEWTGKLGRTHFYHIELRRYDKDAVVETFQPKQLDTLRAEIKKVGAVLADPSTRPQPKGQTLDIATKLASSQSAQLLEIKDRAGKVNELRLKLSAKDMDLALRQTVLKIIFDGHARPQIESPLGDFFGAAPGINPYDSIPMKVEPDGTMTCRFAMPFASKVEILVTNHSPETVEITGQAVVDEYKWDAERDMHFMAHWQVNHNMQVNGRQGFDIPVLMAHGAGRFVGCSVHLMNTSGVPSCNWWGEGDEKIFVDDDGNTPSFFGTGTEDYFNYSWSEPNLFMHAYFAQPRCDGPATRGFIVNNRWQILDDIPFKKRCDFFMEMIHHNVVDGMSYARIAYHYGRPGIYRGSMPIFREDLRVINPPKNWKPWPTYRQQGATYYQLEDTKAAEGLAEEGSLWACGKIAAWRPEKVGQSITMEFDVAKAGNYRMSIVLARSPDSGKCGILVNGKPIKHLSNLDLYEPFHTMERAYSLGRVVLPQGKNTLTILNREKNEKSKGSLIGGDFIWIQP